MFGWFLDPMYLLFLVPTMILAGLATLYTKSTFNKYSRVAASSGYTGAQAAQAMLQSNGVYDVSITRVNGFLSDHYDPTSKTLRLSPQVYGSRSLSAIGVACHEAGHALQHATGYAPLSLRSAVVPAASIGSNMSYFLFFMGMLFAAPGMMKIGALLFSAVVIFSLITLPVEWNATTRAKALMTSAGIVNYSESEKAGRVLNAAFLTYLAAAFTAIMTLLYYLLRSGLLGGSDD